MTTEGIGASVRRKEDVRFLTGRGRYTDDINRPNQVYAAFVRSPEAHARIRSIDTGKARAVAGVVEILTGADYAADKLGGLPTGWLIKSKDGSPMIEPPHPPLVPDVVRHVGDQVAVVLAESRAIAQSAARLVEVTYDPLPAVGTLAAAVRPGAPQIWPQAPNNTCYDWELGDKAATAAAFQSAAHIVKLDVVNNRLVANAMEPRAALAEYDLHSGEFTLYTTTQNPHLARLLLGAFVLQIPESKLRIVAPDVGGGFGSKAMLYAEEVVITWAARRIDRPVKWTATRSEAFVTDAQGRDHLTHAELALDRDGKFLGLRVATLANMGAYLSTFAPAVPTYLYGTLLAGQYRTPAIYVEVRAVFTNTVPVDAYRGAGRPEAAYLIERLVDEAALQSKIDRVELRRRNFIGKDAFPYQTPVALTYDSGDYHALLDQALAAADYAGFEARRREAKARGKLRGIGLSAYIEACGLAPSNIAGMLGARAGFFESAQIRVHPTGTITLFTGSHSHGQGHETTFAQLIAEFLGVPVANVEVVHGDTAKVPFGMGTYGSRSLAVGGNAILLAAQKIVAKGKKIAAHLLEASEQDIEFKDGKFSVVGTDKTKTFGEIAFSAYVPHVFPLETVEPGLDETAFFDPKNFTYPSGVHICEIEIDPETGGTTIVRFTATDDFGRIVNPMIVAGQVQGGVAQGIGQALHEHAIYDEQGGLCTTSFQSYCVPKAADLPNFDLSFNSTAATHNPLGVKGCGEAGAIGAPAAVINAVLDALRPVGVTRLDMPASPSRIWQAIQDARR